MRTRSLLTLAAVAAVVAAPLALAEHGQLADGNLFSYPFQGVQDTYVAVDWVGIGGPGGNTGLGTGTPTPDDCLDIDEYPGQTWYKRAFPSVSVQTTIDRTTLVPGQSVAAPAELVAACSLARQVLLGQETDHEYETPVQAIGFGDVDAEVQAVVSSAGFFSSAFTGQPLTLTVKYCTAAFQDAESTGTESWATYGHNNGRLVVADTPVCDDLTADYLAHLADNPGQQWDAGTFNRIGGGNVYRQSVAHDADGLKIVCVNFDIVDANAAAAGFFEDYSFFFVDNVDGTLVTDFWTDPMGHTDGGAPGLDCNSVGIPL